MAVLFVVAFVDTLTEPVGVKLPVDVSESPVKEGCVTDPAGVYVAVPDAAGETVAVLFSVAFVETDTLPAGVYEPVTDSESPVNVG